MNMIMFNDTPVALISGLLLYTMNNTRVIVSRMPTTVYEQEKTTNQVRDVCKIREDGMCLK